MANIKSLIVQPKWTVVKKDSIRFAWFIVDIIISAAVPQMCSISAAVDMTLTEHGEIHWQVYLSQSHNSLISELTRCVCPEKGP